VNPYQDGMTLRVLETMGRAKQKDEWERTSWLLAKIHNVNCTRSSDTVEPSEVNPMRPRRRRGKGIQVDGSFNRAMHEALSKEAG
jgi:hypothetical protein